MASRASRHPRGQNLVFELREHLCKFFLTIKRKPAGDIDILDNIEASFAKLVSRHELLCTAKSRRDLVLRETLFFSRVYEAVDERTVSLVMDRLCQTPPHIDLM